MSLGAASGALARYDRPEIFNSDQGSQFASLDFIKVLQGEPRAATGPRPAANEIALKHGGPRAPGATTSSSNGSGGR